MIRKEGHWESERVIDLVEVVGGENALLSRPVPPGSARSSRRSVHCDIRSALGYKLRIALCEVVQSVGLLALFKK